MNFKPQSLIPQPSLLSRRAQALYSLLRKWQLHLPVTTSHHWPLVSSSPPGSLSLEFFCPFNGLTSKGKQKFHDSAPRTWWLEYCFRNCRLGRLCKGLQLPHRRSHLKATWHQWQPTFHLFWDRSQDICSMHLESPSLVAGWVGLGMTGVLFSHVRQHMEVFVLFCMFSLSQTLKLNMTFLSLSPECKDQYAA